MKTKKEKILLEFVQNMMNEDLSSARTNLKDAVYANVKERVQKFKKENS